MKYDFDKVEIFDINKARENSSKPSRLKIYDYAEKISAKINESIKKESELGNTQCNIYIKLKDIFGEAGISNREYSRLVDYLASAYSFKGYSISICVKGTMIRDLLRNTNGLLKICVKWE